MITFNGNKIPSFVRVKKINIQTLPAIETNLKSLVGSSGKLAGHTSLGEKIISCDVSIVIPSGYTLQKCGRELAAWLRGDNFKLSPLIISDDVEVRYWGKVSNSVDLSDLLMIGEGTIEFVIPSGDCEATTEKTKTAVNQVEVVNDGTKLTYPEIKLTVGAAVSENTILVQNITSGESLALYGTFKQGDVIVIDCKKNVVKLNDVVNMKILSLTSEFFGLQLGNTVIKCNNTGTEIVVKFCEKYL